MKTALEVGPAGRGPVLMDPAQHILAFAQLESEVRQVVHHLTNFFLFHPPAHPSTGNYFVLYTVSPFQVPNSSTYTVIRKVQSEENS